MENKEKLQAVYDRVKNLKDRFYASKDQSEWDECKKELIPLLDEAKALMTPDFYPKYKQGVVDSVAKMWTYKEPYFNKQQTKKQFQPKVTYLLQDDLADALTKFIQLKTIELSMELEAKKSIADEKKYD